MLTNKM